MKHKLMIKTHTKTGLKYLCYTTKEGREYDEYLGSGIVWLRHLKKYGRCIDTELLFETEDAEEFRRIALQKSIEFDVVNSHDWANQRPEQGDGGDTVSSKCWITNGEIDRYHEKNLPLPDGWRKGRSKCVFNDPEKQKAFGAAVDLEVRRQAIKKAWAEGKMDHRDTSNNIFRTNNPVKRKDVREKIRAAALRDSAARSERIHRIKPWEKRWAK